MTEKCGWVLRCEQGPEAHAHTQPWDMHPGIANHAFVPTDPTRAALSALARFCVEAEMADEDGSCLVCGSGWSPEDHDPSDCPVSEARDVLAEDAIRAALATPPATEERFVPAGGRHRPNDSDCRCMRCWYDADDPRGDR